jgi:ligand-binding sensor domain-containing protein
MRNSARVALAATGLAGLSLLVIGRTVPVCAGPQQEPAAIGQPVGDLDEAIFYIHQAKNGDYWYGSQTAGVYRYDGQILTRFTTKDGLSGDGISQIAEDQTGNLYFGTGAGIDKYDGHSFSRLPMAADSDPHDWRLEPGDLWFKSGEGKQGPYRYDGKALHYLEFPKHFMADEHFKTSGHFPWGPYDIYQIYQDKRGHVWFGTAVFGVCRFDGEKLSWLYERHLSAVEGAGEAGIRSIIEDAQGKFWVSHTRHLFDIHPGVKTGGVSDMVSYDKLPGPGGHGVLPEHLGHADGGDCLWFMSIVEDEQQNLWMACYGAGVYQFDGEKLIHYPVLYNGQPITTFCVYLDPQGGLWVGTHEHGAYKFNGRTFEQFRLGT